MTGVFRDARQAFIIQRDPIEIRLAYIVFIADEINVAALFVHRRMICGARPKTAQIGNPPVAAGQLHQLLTGIVVHIKMPVTASLAGPQKPLTVREKIKIVADVDPIFVGLGQRRR